MITPERIRDLARQIITDYATEVEYDIVRLAVKDATRKDGLTPAERKQLTRTVDDLIGKAAVTVSWPNLCGQKLATGSCPEHDPEEPR